MEAHAPMGRGAPIAMKCETCLWCVGRQCTKAWNDAGTVRQITVDPKAGVDFPAGHVWRFWCMGNGFEAKIVPVQG
jgi:hypothetical protein